MIQYAKRKSQIQYIVIHHSLTKDGQVVDWNAIRKYHIESNGWIDIGYHYGIELAGKEYQIQIGRPEWAQGAHCKEAGMNNKSLGICVVGDYDLAPPPKEAMDLLVILVSDLCAKYHLSEQRIVTHNQYAPYKTCPGTQFPMDDLRARVKKRLEGVKC
jgi:N-acetylmuramoyl-L-alanine amidase